ncbi:MAG TPA: ABC transporter ATP-binding protein, partial [Blastocatellia bacterium]|nr:ABC transporter ATP-binding protein [Blastocatellia bacterium]
MQSPRLTVHIRKQLGAFDLNIEFSASSEILVLFGPSGAGKTQTLNAIAGLSRPDGGEITLDGEPFFRNKTGVTSVDIPARDRRVGYVFQQYALFPHLTALENVAYALWRKPTARVRATALLERLRLGEHVHQYPDELSGGQQQRVAIARALAAEPRVLLLDEPFSALDATIRERLHEDLRAVQQESGLVVVYVTHNLDDALSIGNRLAVVQGGRVAQIGSIEDVYVRPASSTAMEVLGIPNRMAATVASIGTDKLVLDWNGLLLEAPLQPVGVKQSVFAYIRPEAIRILTRGERATDGCASAVSGRIKSVQVGRHFRLVRIALSNRCVIEAHLPLSTDYNLAGLEAGAEIDLEIP